MTILDGKLGEALWRFVLNHGLFDVLSEDRQARVIRDLFASSDPRSRDAAVSRLDLLPEWYDILYEWLGNPTQERYALRSLVENPRLQGPYAITVIRGLLTDRIKDAMISNQPANDLWQLGRVILRWCHVVPEAANLKLDPERPDFTLRQAASEILNLARYVDTLPARRLEVGAGDLASWSEISPDMLAQAAEKSVAGNVAGTRDRSAA